MDLSKIFKSDVTPEIAAVVVKEQADPAVVEAVKDAIQAAGFSVDTVKKGEEITIYQQGEESDGTQLVRLSDDVVIAVKGMSTPADGDFNEMVTTNGFYTGLNGALDVVYSKICQTLCDAEDQKAAAGEISQTLSDFSTYVEGLVKNLPSNAFKMDFAVREVLKAVKQDGGSIAAPKETEVVKEDSTVVEPKAEEIVAVAKEEIVEVQKDAEEGAVHGMQANGTSTTVEESADAVNKKKKAKKEEDEEDEEEDEDADTMASKSEPEVDPVQVLLQSIASKMDSQYQELSSKLTEITATQENHKKIVDELTQKSETLSGKLNSTVIAAPRGGDIPAKATTTATKADKYDYSNDPRTGCFDTAFTRKGRR